MGMVRRNTMSKSVRFIPTIRLKQYGVVNKAVDITLLHVVQPIRILFADQIYKAQIKSDAITGAGNYIRRIIR